ncbi:hypothetical protein [Streptomyces sp. GQFP]|uniref:hypothetical protein n=1 Tax=Streptomyces sp. GQFP TaxID=2907545 RepID=UPI001F3975DA|nr:hypothetical protein [Streptomyces sp. GQFP]UIX29403.1 hypothetical protein LUX31_04765 [Streptomyces sp. GQFP]
MTALDLFRTDLGRVRKVPPARRRLCGHDPGPPEAMTLSDAGTDLAESLCRQAREG